jgi:hypothetical protein
MMYHNSYRYGKAHQEELLRVAGVKENQEIEGIIRSQPKGQGLLRRMIGGILGRKRVRKPAPTITIQEPRHSLSR